MTRMIIQAKIAQKRKALRAILHAGCFASLALGAGFGALSPAYAQNLFAPVATVNESAVTRYELQQRMQLLSVLGGGSTESLVLDSLIEERLKLAAAARVGISVSDEAVATGIRNFAEQGGLSPEQLLTLLGRNGVSAQSFRDYVVAGLVWRDYARARFSSKVNISEADVDRALRNAGPSGGIMVSMSELFLPARNAEERAASERLAKQIAANPSISAFAAAARKYSVAPSGERSGRMDPTPIGNLPGPLRVAASTLKPGEISAPLSTDNAIGIFQLRRLDEIEAPTPRATSLEYAAYYIAGGQTEKARATAAKIRANVDTCDDLYGVVPAALLDQLEIDTLNVSEIPNDVAVELSKLDAGESSTALTRANGQTLVFLMLCDRNFDNQSSTDRDAIRSDLTSKAIGALAANHLAELEADAYIKRN
ncbi:periplasmic chaperone for outer membrane proteins SurA [Pacificibacter maritimus]|uniref:Parvulin-like PPIase n=1 Tax=Pacificibacter maritimus TaxID=762213 RepID=A0A3N4VCQ0_9RHOB|nr:SurA N-terminal domain-containing protein [Pacificibacter maritimus]RPE71620.1 periplasmic chaperone for outer membrane proteins SurA [Pacificibacter maritimus]